LKLRSLLTHLVRAEVSTLLESLDLKEVVFTFDALHCQKKH
jgi:predicted transposase YbfD/YdcC